MRIEWIFLGLNLFFYVYYILQMKKLNIQDVNLSGQQGHEVAAAFLHRYHIKADIVISKRSQYQWNKKRILLQQEHFEKESLRAHAVSMHESAHALQAKKKTMLSIFRMLLILFRIPALIVLIYGYVTGYPVMATYALWVLWAYYIVAYLHESEANRYVERYLEENNTDEAELSQVRQILKQYQSSYAVNALSITSLVLMLSLLNSL